MAKIRTIKPELFRHEELFEAEKKYQLPLRIAFAGLFTCCDREGRFRWKPKQLKLDVLPYDEIDMVDVLNALMASGFIKQYTLQGEQYGCIPSWGKHQYINHREGASVIPSLDEATVLSPETPPVGACTGTPVGKWNGKGTEKEVEMEVEIKQRVVSSTRAQTTINSDVLTVFNHWKTTLQHPQAVLDKKREHTIQSALKQGYTVTQLCDAITGCSKTPHNMGENGQGQRYDGLHIILRDADQIERFMRNAHNPPSFPNATDKLLKTNLIAGQNWLNKKQLEIDPNAIQ